MKKRLLLLVMAILVIAGCAASRFQDGIRLTSAGLDFQCDYSPDPAAQSHAKRLYDLTDSAKEQRVDLCFIPAPVPIALSILNGNGYVMVLSAGLTKRKPHEEMLVCAIAHELAHIDLGHVEEQGAAQEFAADKRAVEILKKSGMERAERWMAETLEWLAEFCPSSATRGEFRRQLAAYNNPELNAWGERLLRSGADVQERVRKILGEEAYEIWRGIPRVGYSQTGLRRRPE